MPYQSYKNYTDNLLKNLVRQAVIVTVVVFAVLVLSLTMGTFNFKMLFLIAVLIYYWVFTVVTFFSRKQLLDELKEGVLETKTITVKKMSRHDMLTYSGRHSFDKSTNYGILKYKIKDADNTTYYFEDVMGGVRILPEVKSAKGMKGKSMEITYTKETRYIVKAKFDADKDTNFIKQEMTGYFQ